MVTSKIYSYGEYSPGITSKFKIKIFLQRMNSLSMAALTVVSDDLFDGELV